MQGEWVRKPTSEASVVFVHGILSSGDACWKHESGAYWPQLLKDEKALDGFGIYVYTYQTNILSGSYSLDDVVDDLKERIKLDNLVESKKLIFVCHSMGGIVVRKFLVERHIDLIEQEIVVGLFLVASPSLGSDYAVWLSQLANLVGHTQATALRFDQDNTWLRSLDKQFINLKESKSAKFKLKVEGKELIEDKFVTAKTKTGWRKLWTNLLLLCWGKQLVEPFSGARYFGEPYKVPGSDHWSIAKPENRDAIQHRLLCNFILDVVMRPPDQKPLQVHKPENKLKPGTGIFCDILKDGSQGPAMVMIRAGIFRMGDRQLYGSEDGNENEQPCHSVRISKPFAIGRYEVTFEEYDRFVSAMRCRLPNDEGWGRGRQPVINVSWDDAVTFAKWLSSETGKPYHLPSEAEWEYAARSGGKDEIWAGTSRVRELSDYAWYDANSGGQTWPVGSKKPNGLGLYDMSGNVWEWVQDHWHDNYDGAPLDGSAWEDEVDNHGQRVVRGGSFLYSPRLLCSSSRNGYFPNDRSEIIGFRVARDLD